MLFFKECSLQHHRSAILRSKRLSRTLETRESTRHTRRLIVQYTFLSTSGSQLMSRTQSHLLFRNISEFSFLSLIPTTLMFSTRLRFLFTKSFPRSLRNQLLTPSKNLIQVLIAFFFNLIWLCVDFSWSWKTLPRRGGEEAWDSRSQAISCSCHLLQAHLWRRCSAIKAKNLAW